MKHLLLALSLFFSSCATLSCAPSPEPSISHHVTVEGPAWMGSGVVVRRDAAGSDVLTAAHVCQALPMLVLVDNRGGKHVGTVERLDPINDLCLLRTTDDLHEVPAELGTLPYHNEMVSNVRGARYSKEVPMVAHHTFISEIVAQGRKLDLYDAGFLPGDSGGGVYDGSGRLVGIVVMYLEDEIPDVGVAVPIAQVRLFLANR